MADLQKYQVKSTTHVDDYKCQLSEELKILAQEELRETEEIRAHGLTAMRDWILANPRIEKCRMDAVWLLRFLRFRKYSIPLAQEALERYLVFREGLYGYDWFSNMNFDRPTLGDLLEKGVIIPLPGRDKLGRQVLMFRLNAVDPSINEVGNTFLTLSTMFFESLLDDEENQIRGLNYIGDVTGLQLGHVNLFPLEIAYKFGKNVEKTCASRHKGFHIINLPTSVQYISNFAMKHMPDKLRERVKFYKSTDEIDIIEKKNLPKEYGGDVSIDQMLASWKQTLADKKDFFLNYNNMKINQKLYPQPVLKCVVSTLKIPLNSADLFDQASNCNDEELSGLQGSFRKLEID